MTQQNNFTEEQIQEIAKAKGVKLAFLVGGLNITDETRQAIIDVLPHLSLEQMERFSDLLEAEYLNQATQDLDDKLKVDLEKIQDKYNEKIKPAQDEALTALDQLEKELE